MVLFFVRSVFFFLIFFSFLMSSDARMRMWTFPRRYMIYHQLYGAASVSVVREPVWRPTRRFGSPFYSKVVVCRHCLETLSLTVNDNNKMALIAAQSVLICLLAYLQAILCHDSQCH